MRLSRVSIPSWFDYNSTSIRIEVNGHQVSIPSWFDYNRPRAAHDVLQ